MAGFSAEGWRVEDPKIISYAEYKLGDDYVIYLGQPAEVDTALGTTGVDTADGNKRWIKPYADTASIRTCVGVNIANRMAKGNDDATRGGLGGYRRDLRLIQFGIVPMKYASGESVITFKTKLAPYPGGFIGWTDGMDVLGYLWEARAQSEQFSLVFIMPGTKDVTP